MGPYCVLNKGIKILGVIAFNGFGSEHKTYSAMLYDNITIINVQCRSI